MVILDEHRNNVTTHRTRLINQLHALLRNLIPGGADRNLSAAAATELLTTAGLILTNTTRYPCARSWAYPRPATTPGAGGHRRRIRRRTRH